MIPRENRPELPLRLPDAFLPFVRDCPKEFADAESSSSFDFIKQAFKNDFSSRSIIDLAFTNRFLSATDPLAE